MNASTSIFALAYVSVHESLDRWFQLLLNRSYSSCLVLGTCMVWATVWDKELTDLSMDWHNLSNSAPMSSVNELKHFENVSLCCGCFCSNVRILWSMVFREASWFDLNGTEACSTCSTSSFLKSFKWCVWLFLLTGRCWTSYQLPFGSAQISL